MTRNFRFQLAIVGTVVFVALMMPTAQAQMTWKVSLGAQSNDMANQAMAFLPNELWIYQHDSITWTSNTNESHTVSFLKQASGGSPSVNTTRPNAGAGCTGGNQGGLSSATSDPSSFDGGSCVNSGVKVIGQSYTVTFPSTGNYKFVCLIHRDMTGVVHVLPLSATLPYVQSDYDKLAADQTKDLINDLDSAKAQNDNPGTGTNQVVATGELVATGGGKAYLAIMRFLPTKIVVHAGETVEWTDVNPAEPHTVTFSPAGTVGTPLEPGAGALIGVTPDDDGARHGTLPNKAGTAVACGLGTSCFSSAIIGPANQDQTAQTAIGITRARVTFTTPGTYDYYCILHEDLGMRGTVVVLK
jgi:plastocyanin